MMGGGDHRWGDARQICGYDDEWGMMGGVMMGGGNDG